MYLFYVVTTNILLCIFLSSPMCCPTTYPIVHAACRLKPPVMASTSVTSPAK